jgi:hypothetical protein
VTTPETVHAVPIAPAAPDASAPSTSYAPTRSQFAGGLGAVATYAAVLVAGRYGVALPDYVQIAIPVVVFGSVAYFVPPTARQVAMRLNDNIVQLAASLPASESQVSKNTVVLPAETKVFPAPGK